MEHQGCVREHRERCSRSAVWRIVALLVTCLLPVPAHAFSQTVSKCPTARIVAVFAGHTKSLTRNGNKQGAWSASGVREYRYNDRVAELFSARSSREIHYKVIPASLNIPYQSRALVAALVGAQALLEIHHDSVQPWICESLLRARTRDPRLAYYRGFSLHVFPASPSLALARDIESSLISAGLTWSTYHQEDIPGERMTLVPGTKATYAREGLALLKQAQMPAVIIECGCIANPSEDNLLKDTHYQAKIVDAVHDAVQNFFRKDAPHVEQQRSPDNLRSSDRAVALSGTSL